MVFGYIHIVIPRFTPQLVPKKGRRKSKQSELKKVDYRKRRPKSKRRKLNFVLLILESSMLLTRNLKKSYKFTVSPRFTKQLVSKKGKVNRMTKEFEVESLTT